VKILILSFKRADEPVLKEILYGISRRTEEYQIRNCVLDNDVLYRDDLIINPICRTLQKNNEDIHLTPYEFDTLYLLAKRPGWVFSRETIYNLIWKEPYNFNEWSVIHTIGRLRKKIGDNGICPRYIFTMRGEGYKFNPILKNEIEE